MHSRRSFFAFVLLIGAAAAYAQLPAPVHNASGLRMLVADEDTQPVLRIVLPGRPLSDRSLEVVFPEHVTAREQAGGVERRLYLFHPGLQGRPPAWHRIGHSLQYETDFPPGVLFWPALHSSKTACCFTMSFATVRPSPIA